MKALFALSISLLLTVSGRGATPLGESTHVGDFPLGCQAYSFKGFTLFEAIEKTKAAGGKTIEIFLWQKLSTNHPGVEANAQMSADQIDALKAKLKANGVRCVSAYFNNNAFAEKDPEAALRKVFEFAKKMDLVSLTGEPPEGKANLDLVEKLVKEYDVRFCLHNHRKDDNRPEYKNWDPHHTAALMKGRDPRMGFCLDTGHTVRSGLNPVDALRTLEGRVFALHLKDPISVTGHDTIFGQGVGNVKRVLDELRRQKFDGYISIEYEHNWDDSVPDIRQCVEFVRKHSAGRSRPLPPRKPDDFGRKLL